ncbi:class I SAM-dependent methyltransferase [Chloroflexota bacterium]
MSQVPLYDALGADYDRFVNWEGRLAHELPFLDRNFREQGVQRVLDAACGTGRHAIALAQRGYRVMGTDLSAVMIERAVENAAEVGQEVSFRVAGLGEAATLGETFDAVLCLGNSLPHLLSSSAVVETVTDFATVLRPGGLLVIQNRNFDRVCAERERFMSPQSYRDGDREWLFVRFYDFYEETITFNMMRLRRTEQGWKQDVQSTELRPILLDELAAALTEAGFGECVFFGSYDGSAFDAAQSGDLITIARKN